MHKIHLKLSTIQALPDAMNVYIRMNFNKSWSMNKGITSNRLVVEGGVGNNESSFSTALNKILLKYCSPWKGCSGVLCMFGT